MKIPMEQLRDELIESIEPSLKELNKIEFEEIRSACTTVVKQTLDTIIDRINEHYITLEIKRIEDAWDSGLSNGLN
jgi:uncharacterized protein (DUF433 family)